MDEKLLRAVAIAGAAALAAFAVRSVVQRRKLPAPRRVAVASTASQKLDAAASALNATVVGAKVPSLVDDQPIGIDATMRGAKNRMEGLLETEAVQEADLAVAIENGLLRCLGCVGHFDQNIP